MILIVDDDEPTRRVMQRLLANYGYEARTAATIGETLAMIEQKMPKLILLDVMLQETNGLQLLGTLRNNPATAELPVLIHTACITPNSEHEAKRLGADGLLKKGTFDVTFLINRIRAFVEPDWACCKLPRDQIA